MKMIEQALNNGFANTTKEKSFTDKLLAKDEVFQVKELMKKENLTREDLKELMYMLSSNEMKLVNYSEWNRYVMAKFFVWIRELINLYEGFLDYKEEILDKNDKCKDDTTKKNIKNIQAEFDHNVKYIVDVYYNLARTSLSIGGSGFKELLTNHFEVAYPSAGVQTNQVNPRNNFLGFKGGKNN